MGLDAVNREAVDLENITIEEALENLKCTRAGLISGDVAIMAFARAHGGGKDPDYHDFVGIIILLVINSTISFIEENNAGNAAAALMARLASKTKIATMISATANWKFAGIKSIGWGWTGVIWLFKIVTYLALDPLKFAVRYALSGRAWGLLVNQRLHSPTKRTSARELVRLHGRMTNDQ